MIKCFSPEVCEKLDHYVYRLIDPRNGQTFYVGQGVGNRVFAHIKDELKYADNEEKISEKIDQIRAIRASGLEVIHIIQRHGLSKKEADEVEAALIDAYPGLKNIQGGYHSNERGVNSAEFLEYKYSLKEYEEPNNIKYMIIKTSNERYENYKNQKCSDYDAIYEATRKSWKVGKDRVDKIKYVLGVIDGIVREVFEVEKWQLADNGVRYEFIGHIASDEIRNIFKDKRIPEKYSKKGSANPIQYHD